MRTFVAFRCAERCARKMGETAQRLARLDDALRVPPQREKGGDEFHLTLQFLGDTNENDVPAIGRALEEVAERFAPIDVRYEGLGAFPEPARARDVRRCVPSAKMGRRSWGRQAVASPKTARSRSVPSAGAGLGS